MNINKERERDEHYKSNYNKFVNNFKIRVGGDEGGEYYKNDLTYNWLYRLETYRFNRDINDFRGVFLGTRITDIKEVIDDGRVDNY